MWPRILAPSSTIRPLSSLPGADRAVSEVVGSLFMASITVGMAITFGHALMEGMPSDTGPSPRTFEIELGPGDGGWNDGDEQVGLRHTSGQPLDRNDTTIRITVAAKTHSFKDAGLKGSFEDGELSIGERWEATLSVPADSTVDVQVVEERSSARVLASSALRSGSLDCSSDTTSPHAAMWSTSPEDLDASSQGAFNVTVTLEDACSGIDTGTTPHLYYRIGDGSGFTDAGGMEHLGATSWRGSVPEPGAGWADHGGETLTYKVDPMADQAGNTGSSEEREEGIEPDDELGGELTYVSDYTIFSGTVTGFDAAKSADDDGATATLEENVTSPNATRSEAYGTAHSSSSDVVTPGDATGSPDQLHAGLPGAREWLGVEGFRTASGEILAVELAFQGHYDGTVNGDSDAVELSYRLGSEEGETSKLFDTAALSSGSDGSTEYVNVSADRAWTWQDIDDLQVRTTYEKAGPEDDLSFEIDALWVRVTYDDPAYNMSIRMDVASLPSGDHELEIRYSVSDETHHVEVWNATAGAWERQGSSLSATSLRSWDVALADEAVSSGDLVFRIVDDGRDPDQQSTVELDHARVRTR